MAQVTDSGPDTAGDYLYHVVCHDCPNEALSSEAADAEARRDEHRESTGHHIEFAAVPSGNEP